MQHRIHTFRAATMDEALDLVRRELGKDAIVVESKEIARRRLLPWPSTQLVIEIRAKRLSRQEQSVPAPAKLTAPRVIRTLAEKMSASQEASSLTVTPPGTISKTAKLERGKREQLSPPPKWLSENRSTSIVDLQNSVHVPKDAIASGVKSKNESAPSAETRGRIPVAAVVPDYQQNLESLRTIVAQLDKQSRSRGLADVPSDLLPHYARLLEADIEDDVARDLVAKVQRQTPMEKWDTPAAVTAALTALIEREFPCTSPIVPRTGRREIVTLVGPTGVGKTTTLAKLAGQFHLHRGFRVGLITVDNYRVAAIEQLRVYAEILQVPLHAASTPDEVRAALDAMDDIDIILIDTAGRSPRDASQLSELGKITDVTCSTHVLLVLSLTTSPKMFSTIASQFASANPTSLVLTKLDEAIGGGALLSVAREVSLPITYFTMGQEVPDQIEAAHATRLAQLVLDRDKLHKRPH